MDTSKFAYRIVCVEGTLPDFYTKGMREVCQYMRDFPQNHFRVIYLKQKKAA